MDDASGASCRILNEARAPIDTAECSQSNECHRVESPEAERALTNVLRLIQ